MPELMYRYREIKWSLGCDQFDNPYPGHRLEVCLDEYPILKRTPKGVWIEYGCEKKFVLNNSLRRFACETKELAKESFKRRKLKQCRILQAQLDSAKLALELVDAEAGSNNYLDINNTL